MIPKLMIKSKDLRTAKSILRKKKKEEEPDLLNIKTHVKVTEPKIV